MNEHNLSSEPTGDPQDRLYAWFLNDLDATERAELERDLESDPALRTEFERLRRRFRLLLSHQAPLPSNHSLQELFARARKDLERLPRDGGAGDSLAAVPAAGGRLLRMPYARVASAALVLVCVGLLAVSVALHEGNELEPPATFGSLVTLNPVGGEAISASLTPGTLYYTAAGEEKILRLASGGELRLHQNSAARVVAKEEHVGLELVFGDSLVRVPAGSAELSIQSGERQIIVGGELQGVGADSVVALTRYEPLARTYDTGDISATMIRQPLSRVLELDRRYGMSIELSDRARAKAAETYVDVVVNGREAGDFQQALSAIGLVLRPIEYPVRYAVDVLGSSPRHGEVSHVAVVSLAGTSRILGADGQLQAEVASGDAGPSVWGQRSFHEVSGVVVRPVQPEEYRLPEVVEVVSPLVYETITQSGSERIFMPSANDSVVVYNRGQRIEHQGEAVQVIDASGDRTFLRDSRGRYRIVRVQAQ